MTGITTYFISKDYVSGLHTLTGKSIFLIYLLFFPGISSFAQSENEFGEISVFLEVQGYGGKEIDAVVKDEELYLPVLQFFQFLEIRTSPSPGTESITGLFIDKESTFLIDGNKNEIQFCNDVFRVRETGIITHESALFLSAYYFDKIFGLECIYNRKKQSVTVNFNLELPVTRELRQNDLDSNLDRLMSEDVSDIVIKERYPKYKFGMADWSVNSKQEINGPTETNIKLGFGSVIAGGEANALLNYNSNEPLTEKQQHYLWRYVDNYNSTVSQISVGKIKPFSTATIDAPVIGVQLTNRPTTLRRSSGTYTISDRTEPNWIVELYVNNVLVEYAMADADGFFTFELPLTYGNAPIRLKFFSPWGEEKSEERNIYLPFYFAPVKTLEYDLSAGIIEDSLRTKFLRTDVNYGLSQNVTIGVGYERLSSFRLSPLMPFVKGSFRLASDLILTGEFTYKVGSKGNLIYKLPSNIQFDLNYSRYNPEQEALDHNYLEERSASVLMPIRLPNFSAYNRISFNQLVRPTIISTSAEWLLSGSFFGINTNINTSGLFFEGSSPTIFSKLSLSYRFNSGLRISPMVQYGYTDRQLLSLGVILEKKLIKKAYLHVSFLQDFKRNMQHAELGFRYNFNFAQTGISGIRSENSTFLTQFARGSFIHDGATRYLEADNGYNVGKGGLTIIPFIDADGNGRRDPGESKAPGLALRTSAGQIQRIEEDTTIRIFGLEAYTKLFIEFDDSGFDSHLLNLSNRTYSMFIKPNMFRIIELPISIVGEVSGRIMIHREEDTIGVESMLVRIYEEGQSSGEVIVGNEGVFEMIFRKVYKLTGETRSDSIGQYKFSKLALGTYTVRLDSMQLHEQGMTCNPDSITFEILPNVEKASIKGLDFILQKMPEEEELDSIKKVIPDPVVKITKKDSTYVKVHEVIQEVYTDTTDSYAIQLGAFSKKPNAIAFKKKLAGLLDKEIEIVVEDGMFKVRILGFESRDEVDEYIPILSKNGITVLWVINLKGMMKQDILMTVRDTITEVTEIRTEMRNPEDRSDLYIQLGAFRDSSKADALHKRLSDILDQPVIIEKEYGYFKVRVTGFKMPEERDAILPQLENFGYDEIWVLPYDTAYYESLREPPVEEIAEIEADSSIVVKDEAIKPEVVEEDGVEEQVVEEDGVEEDVKGQTADPVVKQEQVEEPRFSIQAGVFSDFSEARRAKRRIENELDLPVILKEEFDYVRVIIPGFYKRVDTYKYYPLLVGLGYDNIKVIEKSK